MTDKVQKIRKEVERLKSNLIYGACSSQIAMETMCKEEAYNEILAILDSMQEEPVSEDFEKIVEEIAEPTILNAYGTKELARRLRNTICYISVSEELEEASKEWLRPQLDKSYANYGEAKMMELTHFDGYAMLDAIEFGAKWQKEQLMAKAVDGDITFDYYGDDDKTYGCIAHDSFCLEDFGPKDMDKVKVIVIKED